MGYNMPGSLPSVRGGAVYVRRLRTARPVDDLKGDLVSFVEGLETLHLDGRKVNKHISPAVLALDEAVPLLRVEPFYATEHFLPFLLPLTVLRRALRAPHRLNIACLLAAVNVRKRRM